MSISTETPAILVLKVFPVSSLDSFEVYIKVFEDSNNRLLHTSLASNKDSVVYSSLTVTFDLVNAGGESLDDYFSKLELSLLEVIDYAIFSIAVEFSEVKVDFSKVDMITDGYVDLVSILRTYFIAFKLRLFTKE